MKKRKNARKPSGNAQSLPMMKYPVTIRYNSTGKVQKTSADVDINLIKKAQARGQTIQECLSFWFAARGITLLDVGELVPTTLADEAAHERAAQRSHKSQGNRSTSPEISQYMCVAAALQTSSRIQTVIGNLARIPVPAMYMPLDHPSQIDSLNRQTVADYVKTFLKENPKVRDFIKEVAELTAQNRNLKDQYFEKVQQVLNSPLPQGEYQQACAISPMSEAQYISAELIACETLFSLNSKFSFQVHPTIGLQTINTCDEKFLFGEDEILSYIAAEELS